MKSCGIIVEYNPFHNGHLYHMKMAKKLTNATVIVAVMSGNFLQRGEPAIVDKWARAKQALSQGVDLVIELPFAYAVQSADYFARGAIKILQALNCETLCFGTETGDNINYEFWGQFIAENQEKMNQVFHQMKNTGDSYPMQMMKTFQKICPEEELTFSLPNQILGLSYAKENANHDNPMRLFPLKREVVGYHDPTIHRKFASASAIRTAVLSNKSDTIKKVVPCLTLQDLKELPSISWNDFWPLLKYKLISSSYLELQNIYQMTEGIEYRLKESVKKATSFDMFIHLAKTKRYTWTRLQRLSTYILLNVTKKEIEDCWEDNYVRVLGFTQTGQKFLHQQKKNGKLPIISKINQSNSQKLALDIRGDNVYQLANSSISEQIKGRYPLLLN